MCLHTHFIKRSSVKLQVPFEKKARIYNSFNKEKTALRNDVARSYMCSGFVAKTLRAVNIARLNKNALMLVWANLRKWNARKNAVFYRSCFGVMDFNVKVHIYLFI